MQFSDPRYIDVFLNLTNKYDIEEFVSKCKENNLVVRGSELEYAQKIGMLDYAVQKYKGKPVIEAYMLLVSGANMQTFTSETGCSGCGGGQVK